LQAAQGTVHSLHLYVERLPQQCLEITACALNRALVGSGKLFVAQSPTLASTYCAVTDINFLKQMNTAIR
jgi:hypothetical protein